MPKFIRKNLKGIEYVHITIHGIADENIFEEVREKYEFKKLMLENQQQFNIYIIAYCIMDNHVHLLVKIQEPEDLSNYMHKINTLYAIYYNKNRKRSGYVYKGRFYSQIILDKKHFVNCIIYIHNNPVKAKMCKHAKDYYFSSYKDFLQKSKVDEIKNIFGSKKEYEIKHKNMKWNNDFEKITENEVKEIINCYLKDKKIKTQQLKTEKEEMIYILKELKFNYNVSYRQLEKITGIGRETIRRLIIDN